MKAICFRIDLTYNPFGEESNADIGEPSYIVKILEAGWRAGVRFQFFSYDRALNIFPSVADIIAADGHAFDPIINLPKIHGHHNAPKLTKELGNILESFTNHSLDWEGIAIDGAQPDGRVFGLLREHFRWTALHNPPHEHAGDNRFKVILCDGPVDTDFFNSDNPDADVTDFLEETRKWMELHADLVVVTLHPKLLWNIDPACAYLRNAIKLADQYERKIVSLREWFNN